MVSDRYNLMIVVVELNQGLFTRREGYPSKRVTLALTHFLFFSSLYLQGSQGYLRRWVTLSMC